VFSAYSPENALWMLFVSEYFIPFALFNLMVHNLLVNKNIFANKGDYMHF